MYLLDTNVVSELRKAKRAHPNLQKWTEKQRPVSMYISAITLLELETGILLIERRDQKQGAVLRAWMHEHVLRTFADRTLPIDSAIALRCAALQVPNPRSDRDALIAATALVHGMRVVTRNANYFEPMGVAVINPWELEK